MWFAIIVSSIILSYGLVVIGKSIAELARDGVPVYHYHQIKRPLEVEFEPMHKHAGNGWRVVAREK